MFESGYVFQKSEAIYGLRVVYNHLLFMTNAWAPKSDHLSSIIATKSNLNCTYYKFSISKTVFMRLSCCRWYGGIGFAPGIRFPKRGDGSDLA